MSRDEKYCDVLQRLKEERVRNNWTQEVLCNQLLVTQSHYSKMEQGKKRFSYKELQRLNETGIDLYYVFTGHRVENQDDDNFLENCEMREQFFALELLYAITKYYSSLNHINQNKFCEECIEYKRYLMSGSKSRNLWRLVRDYHGYTQRQMAVILEMDVKTYRSLENQENHPDSEIVFAMYKHFDVPLWIMLENNAGIVQETYRILGIFDQQDRRKVFEYLESGVKQIMREE